MNKSQFKTVKTLVRDYMNGLNLTECKNEIIKNGLLTVNKKLSKGEKANYGLELLPSVVSGKNLCKGAGQCKYHCLAFSGVGNIFKSKKIFAGEDLSFPLKAKARKTFVYLNDMDFFVKALKAEITHKSTLAQLADKEAYFRLNVTSDIDWRFLTDSMPEVNFYDYTKVWDRKSTSNYHLTFSASEKTDNFQIFEKLSLGENIAIVFNEKELPKTIFDIPVIDGDITDDRSYDPKGVIVGLKVKTIIGGRQKNKFFFQVEDFSPLENVA